MILVGSLRERRSRPRNRRRRQPVSAAGALGSAQASESHPHAPHRLGDRIAAAAATPRWAEDARRYPVDSDSRPGRVAGLRHQALPFGTVGLDGSTVKRKGRQMRCLVNENFFDKDRLGLGQTCSQTDEVALGKTASEGACYATAELDRHRGARLGDIPQPIPVVDPLMKLPDDPFRVVVRVHSGRCRVGLVACPSGHPFDSGRLPEPREASGAYLHAGHRTNLVYLHIGHQDRLAYLHARHRSSHHIERLMREYIARGVAQITPGMNRLVRVA